VKVPLQLSGICPRCNAHLGENALRCDTCDEALSEARKQGPIIAHFDANGRLKHLCTGTWCPDLHGAVR
jgi:hypothetical protein